MSAVFTLPDRIVLASGNRGKLREIDKLFDGFDVTVVPQQDLGVSDADETGVTFAENALLKAQHAVTVTGLPAIADDSGLSVDALDGAPGVWSARYAGADATDADNIDKLLAALAEVDDNERGAAFHCCLCLLLPGRETPLLANGEWRGSILRQRQGDRGFGYDPVFLDPASGLSAAQLSPEQKNARSHRGQALRALLAAIQSKFNTAP